MAAKRVHLRYGTVVNSRDLFQIGPRRWKSVGPFLFVKPFCYDHSRIWREVFVRSITIVPLHRGRLVLKFAARNSPRHSSLPSRGSQFASSPFITIVHEFDGHYSLRYSDAVVILSLSDANLRFKLELNRLLIGAALFSRQHNRCIP